MSMTRRSFMKQSFALGACSVLTCRSSSAAQKASMTAAQMRADGALAKITIQKLRRGVTALMGSGGNILVIAGRDGQLTVDSGYATSEPQIRAALKQISPEPLKHLLNTHWHYDHTDGNQWMHLAGARIVAQAQTLVRMSSRQTIPEFDAILLPSPKAALPQDVFRESYGLNLNQEDLRILRYTPAHTDSDVSVFFAKANVLHTGDTWFNGFYPFIDYNSGGSIGGMLAASAENLERCDKETIVVPGHGNAGTREDLVRFREMLLATHESVHQLKRSGRSFKEVFAARPTAPFDGAWGAGFISPELFTGLIYRGT